MPPRKPATWKEQDWSAASAGGTKPWACDPTEGHCELKVEEFTRRRRCGCEHAGVGRLCPACERQALAECGLCPACQVFGATGWAKTFTIATGDGTGEGYPPTGQGRVETTGNRLNQKKKQPSAWYFPRGRPGPLSLTLLPRRPNDGETVPLLLGLLEFIHRNAALGARTNLGYGLFEWEERPANLPSAETFAALVARRAGIGRRGGTGRWPDLREMFFAEVHLGESWEPADFVNFKYDLRAAFRDGRTIQRLLPNTHQRRQLRHFLLGTVRDDPNQASKIKMALLPDRRTLRVWGWVPEDLTKEATGKMSRKAVMDVLGREIARQGALTRWREFDSGRDTANRFTDSTAYLRSLMEE